MYTKAVKAEPAPSDRFTIFAGYTNISQANPNTPITFGQEMSILVIAMLTSKGASGVTGAGFVTLAATLAIVPDIPIQSIAIILGIDKFMSECRALTNLVGNGVATVVISRWEGELDVDKLHEAMAHPIAVGEEMEALPI